MVDVRVGEKHVVDPAFGHGQRRVFVQVHALLHAVVHHDVLPRCLQKKPAARHLAGRAQKRQLHAMLPPLQVDPVAPGEAAVLRRLVFQNAPAALDGAGGGGAFAVAGDHHAG